MSASGLPPDAASSRLDAFAGPPAQVHHHHKNFITLDIIIATSPYHRTQISTHHHHICILCKPKGVPHWKPPPRFLPDTIATCHSGGFTQVREENRVFQRVLRHSTPLPIGPSIQQKQKIRQHDEAEARRVAQISKGEEEVHRPRPVATSNASSATSSLVHRGRGLQCNLHTQK